MLVVQQVPQSIMSPDEELSIRAHNLYQEILECLSQIEATFETLSRLLYKFVSEPRLMEAMGWETAQDMFSEPEIQAKLTKMRLNSPAQVFRWQRLARLDERMPQFGVLRYDKLSVLAQSGKLKQLEDLADKVELKDVPLDNALVQVESIIAAPPPEPEKDPPPFEIKGDIGYWKGKQAIRFTGKGLASLHLRARLLHRPFNVKFYPDTGTIVVYNRDTQDGTKEGALILLDTDWLEYLGDKLRIRINVEGVQNE